MIRVWLIGCLWLIAAGSVPALAAHGDAEFDDLAATPAFQPPADGPHFATADPFGDEWRVLPPGLLYHSYIAGEKEPRFQFLFLNEGSRGMVWETMLGGRLGIVRYGTLDLINPEGWQFDIEGAAQPRINPEQNDDVEAVDYRVGCVLTWKRGPNALKGGYYHLSSHLGDEFLITNPGYKRLNYVRDSLIFGWTRNVTTDTQVYAEVAAAFNYEDGAEPFEFQGGVQYSPFWQTGLRGAPFAAVNVHTRQDFNFATSVNVLAGWQWRGLYTGHRFRAGLQYYNGPAMQWSFAGQHESLFGGGLWADY